MLLNRNFSISTENTFQSLLAKTKTEGEFPSTDGPSEEKAKLFKEKHASTVNKYIGPYSKAEILKMHCQWKHARAGEILRKLKV